MTVRRVVVDASALIAAADPAKPAWGETLSYLRGTFGLEAPALIASESGTVVHTKDPASFGKTPRARAEFLEALLEAVDLIENEESSRRRCGDLVGRTGLSFYDCEYLELAARDEESILVTQDDRQRKSSLRVLGAGRALTLDEAAARIAAGTL